MAVARSSSNDKASRNTRAGVHRAAGARWRSPHRSPNRTADPETPQRSRRSTPRRGRGPRRSGPRDPSGRRRDGRVDARHREGPEPRKGLPAPTGPSGPRRWSGRRRGAAPGSPSPARRSPPRRTPRRSSCRGAGATGPRRTAIEPPSGAQERPLRPPAAGGRRRGGSPASERSSPLRRGRRPRRTGRGRWTRRGVRPEPEPAEAPSSAEKRRARRGADAASHPGGRGPRGTRRGARAAARPPRVHPDPRLIPGASRPSAMRIGILCHPTYGGSGVVASEPGAVLAENGHAVHLFSHEVPPRLARGSGGEPARGPGQPYPLFHSTPTTSRSSRV